MNYRAALTECEDWLAANAEAAAIIRRKYAFVSVFELREVIRIIAP